MKGSIVSEKLNGKHQPFAIRIIMPEPPHEDVKISSHVVPIPSLGAVGVNFQYRCEMAIELFDLKEQKAFPITLPHTSKVKKITATCGADIVQLRDGENPLVVERWFAVGIPDGCRSLADYIAAYLKHESKSLAENRRKQNRVIHADKGSLSGEVNITRSQSTAYEALLRKQFPRMYQAIGKKSDADVIRRAYLADRWALLGKCPPDLEDSNAVIQDEAFTRWLSASLQNPGEVDEAEWLLVSGWIALGFYQMGETALRDTLNKKSGLKLSASGWRKKAKALGLLNARKLGRPEKHSLRD